MKDGFYNKIIKKFFLLSDLDSLEPDSYEYTLAVRKILFQKPFLKKIYLNIYILIDLIV